jgi:cyclophilin family peptidyl-prolyl cis-trans isomerase
VSGSNRNRPRSSKKRRAIAAATPPPTQRVRGSGPRPRADAGPPGRRIPPALIVVGLLAFAGVLIGFGTGFIRLGPEPVTSSVAGKLSVASSGPSTPASGGASAGVRGTGCPTSPPPALPAGQKRIVTIGTAKGTIEITVEADLGPRAAGNFVALAQCGFYEGVVFHRLVPGFVIQGGDPQGTGRGGPGYTFQDDPVTVPYERGVVAMANSGPNTNGSQFFIVLAKNSLGPNYSVFGRVTAGMEAVDAIAAMPNSGGQSNAAINPVAMDSVTVRTP